MVSLAGSKAFLDPLPVPAIYPMTSASSPRQLQRGGEGRPHGVQPCAPMLPLLLRTLSLTFVQIKFLLFL